jgi:endonuclease/exonuclease/phosphatase family metal-dependent hydrolase
MKNKNISIISYNLKWHRASQVLDDLVAQYDPDILSLQECHADKLPDQIGDLVLADKTPNTHLNIATYYRKDRFFSTDSSCHQLRRALVEVLFFHRTERLLITNIYDRISGKEITIGSFHATPHVTTNRLRRHQITTSHELLKSNNKGGPTIMVGDYNYLMFKRGLRLKIRRTGYELKLSEQPTYYFNKYLRVRYDMASSLNAQIEQILALPKSALSDHTPILVQVSV